MAAKKKSPITGLPSGIIDDVIIPIARKVLKGKTKEKVLTKAMNKAYKGSAKAGAKYDKAIERKVAGRSRLNLGLDKPLMNPLVEGRQIRKQLTKNISSADRGNALLTGESTVGIKKIAKQQAKYMNIKNPNLYGKKKSGY